MNWQEWIPWIIAVGLIVLQKYGIKLPWSPTDPNGTPLPTDLPALLKKLIDEALSRWLPNLATKQEVQQLFAENRQSVESAIVNRPAVDEAKKIRLGPDGSVIIPPGLIEALKAPAA